MSTQETGSDTGHEGQAHGIHTAPETGGTVGAQAFRIIVSARLNGVDGDLNRDLRSSLDLGTTAFDVTTAPCVTEAQHKALVHLIAAAPDLLAALEVSRRHLYCKVTKRWLNPSEFDTSCDCVSCEDSRQINLAIAKASGR